MEILDGQRWGLWTPLGPLPQAWADSTSRESITKGSTSGSSYSGQTFTVTPDTDVLIRDIVWDGHYNGVEYELFIDGISQGVLPADNPVTWNLDTEAFAGETLTVRIEDPGGSRRYGYNTANGPLDRGVWTIGEWQQAPGNTPPVAIVYSEAPEDLGGIGPYDAAVLTESIARSDVSLSYYYAQTCVITPASDCIIRAIEWDGHYNGAEYELCVGGISQGVLPAANPIRWDNLDIPMSVAGTVQVRETSGDGNYRYQDSVTSPPQSLGHFSAGVWVEAPGGAKHNYVPLSIEYSLPTQ